jgi:hypothetical protein
MLKNQRVVSFAVNMNCTTCVSRLITEIIGFRPNCQVKKMVKKYTLFWKSQFHPLASCMISFPNKVWKSINSRHPHAVPGKCCTGSAGGVDLLWRTGGDEGTGHIMLSAQFPVVHKHPPGSVDVSQIFLESKIWLGFPGFNYLRANSGALFKWRSL